MKASINEQNTLEAIARIKKSPLLPIISSFFFPKQPIGTLYRLLKDVNTVEDFQIKVMSKIVAANAEQTSSSFVCLGLDNIEENSSLIVSNHRDITLDSAFLQWQLLSAGKPSTDVCIGNNLLKGGKFVSDMLLANRMIMVERALSPRQLYQASLKLSNFIRDAIVSKRSSVWIAQREGRAKNGMDLTEPGLIKMFDMSGDSDLLSNFIELSIVPMSISYEYEPCGARKARELLLSQSGMPYVKRKNEDTQSIIRGIKQWKGGIHIEIGNKLTESELNKIVRGEKKASYMALKAFLDEKIVKGYKLWKTNYMAYDLTTNSQKYSDFYSADDLKQFVLYTEKELSKLELGLNRSELRKIFWSIYANPVVAKEKLNNE